MSNSFMYWKEPIQNYFLRDNNLILHLNIVSKNEFVSIPFQIPFEHLAKLHKTHEKQKRITRFGKTKGEVLSQSWSVSFEFANSEKTIGTRKIFYKFENHK